MKCRKKIVLIGYRVQFVDLREPKPRTPKEHIHVVDHQWRYAMGMTGQNVIAHIQSLYERAGYDAFIVEQIKPKRVAEIDLCQIWNELEPPATEETPINTAEEDTADGY